MADILREVEEEVRKDQWIRFANRWGIWIGGAIVAGLLGYAGYTLWQGQQARAAQEASASYDQAIKALEQGNFDEGLTRLNAIAENAPAGLASVAALQAAAVHVEKGDLKAAVAAYDSAIARIADPDLKALATLKAAYAAASSGADRAAVEARVKALSEGETAFAPLARELMAALAWQAGEGAKARPIYAALSLDPNAPEGLRQRANQALAAIDAGAAIAREPLPDQQGPMGPGGQQIPPELLAQLQAQQMAQMQAQAAAQAEAQAAQNKARARALQAQEDARIEQALGRIQQRAAAPEEAAPAPPAGEPAPAEPAPAPAP